MKRIQSLRGIKEKFIIQIVLSKEAFQAVVTIKKNKLWLHYQKIKDLMHIDVRKKQKTLDAFFQKK